MTQRFKLLHASEAFGKRCCIPSQMSAKKAPKKSGAPPGPLKSLPRPTKDPSYRENPERSIQVFGRFDAEMVRRLTPSIVKLRHDHPEEPITVYIDSGGGSIQHYHYLEGLLFRPDQDGNRCRIITVATSFAASAAARLLARGDYSIAYPSAVIHCHGARYEGDLTLTREKAESMSESLADFNADMASDFTHKIIENLAWLFRFNDDLIVERNDGPHIYGLSSLIRDSISRENAILVADILRELGLTSRLQRFLGAPARVKSLQTAAIKGVGHRDFRLLKFVVDFLSSKATALEFANGTHKSTMSQLTSLYSLQREYHKNFINDCDDPEALLMMLCNQEQLAKAKSIVDDEARTLYLVDTVGDVMFTSWQLGTTIASNLVKGENSLTAPDAYWLGIVDEVVGRSDLPCKRHVVEATT